MITFRVSGPIFNTLFMVRARFRTISGCDVTLNMSAAVGVRLQIERPTLHPRQNVKFQSCLLMTIFITRKLLALKIKYKIYEHPRPKYNPNKNIGCSFTIWVSKIYYDSFQSCSVYLNNSNHYDVFSNQQWYVC